MRKRTRKNFRQGEEGAIIKADMRGFVHGPEFRPTVRMVAISAFRIKAVSTGSHSDRFEWSPERDPTCKHNHGIPIEAPGELRSV